MNYWGGGIFNLGNEGILHFSIGKIASKSDLLRKNLLYDQKSKNSRSNHVIFPPKKVSSFNLPISFPKYFQNSKVIDVKVCLIYWKIKWKILKCVRTKLNPWKKLLECLKHNFRFDIIYHFNPYNAEVLLDIFLVLINFRKDQKFVEVFLQKVINHLQRIFFLFNKISSIFCHSFFFLIINCFRFILTAFFSFIERYKIVFCCLTASMCNRFEINVCQQLPNLLLCLVISKSSIWSTCYIGVLPGN